MCPCARVQGQSIANPWRAATHPTSARQTGHPGEGQNPPPPNASMAKQQEIVSEADFSIGGKRT